MIDKEVVIHKISKLASIALTAQESLDLKEDIKRIVDFVSELEKVSTEDVEPLVSLSSDALVWRADRVAQDATREDILSNTAHVDQGMFLVPKIME